MPLPEKGPPCKEPGDRRERSDGSLLQARRIDPTLAAKHHRLMVDAGKQHGSALCHVATTLLTRVLACLRSRQPYQLRDVGGSFITIQQPRTIITERHAMPKDLQTRRKTTTNAEWTDEARSHKRCINRIDGANLLYLFTKHAGRSVDNKFDLCGRFTSPAMARWLRAASYHAPTAERRARRCPRRRQEQYPIWQVGSLQRHRCTPVILTAPLSRVRPSPDRPGVPVQGHGVGIGQDGGIRAAASPYISTMHQRQPTRTNIEQPADRHEPATGGLTYHSQ
jgi:hypothetical protein